MTTQNKSGTAKALIKMARALRNAAVFEGLACWGVSVTGGLLALMALDNLLHLPQVLRFLLDGVLCGFSLLFLFRKVLQPFFRPLSPSQAARALEIKRGITDNVLINAYDFEREGGDPRKRKYVDAILDSSQATLKSIRPQSIWLTQKLEKWTGILLLLLTAGMVMGVLFPRQFMVSLNRIFLPLADVPPLGRWQPQVQPAGFVTVTKGDDLKISVHVQSLDAGYSRPPVPIIVWREGVTTIAPSPSVGAHASMLPGVSESDYVYTFKPVNQPLSFRVWVDDCCSAAVAIRAFSLPGVKSFKFEVTPPPYTGLKTYSQPGPSIPLNVPIGSTVVAAFDLDSDPAAILWRVAKNEQPVAHTGNLWEASSTVNDTQYYEILSVAAKGEPAKRIAQGQITPLPDYPPEVDFVTEDRNRLATPGSKLDVTVRATDDYGVASISLLLARSDDPTTVKRLKTWSFMGPPGQKEPPPESYEFEVDPLNFTPGSTFVLTAEATDFSPQGQPTRSRPILLRVSGLKDLTVPPNDALDPLFNMIKALITRQMKANGLTDNLVTHLTEAVAAQDLYKVQKAMADAQRASLDSGSVVILEEVKHPEADAFSARLETLVNREMVLALIQIGKVGLTPEPNLSKHLGALQNRQNYILSELISILGQISTSHQDLDQNKAARPAPPVSVAETMESLREDLNAFVEDQKMVMDATSALKDRQSYDLTTENATVLGDLARTEVDKGRFFQEKLADFSKLSLQDFADGKVVSEMSSVFQDVKTAADALYKKDWEVALAAELNSRQEAQKLKGELEQNLERSLPKTPDTSKWMMEGGLTQGDASPPELSKGLKDILGDLFEKEESIGADNSPVRLSGGGAEGLEGALSPASEQKLAEMMEQQIKVRQEAEAIAIELRKQWTPTGELETAINAMKQFEEAAKTQNGTSLYQQYHQAMGALAAARNTCQGGRLNHVEINSMDSQPEVVPPGYEEMIGAYFKSLNEMHQAKP